jgi:hypothetical protein
VHLFDIDVPNGIRFKESDVLSAGSKIVSTFDVPSFGRVGVAICYDIRFSSAIELLAKDCKLLVVPAAFNLTTGLLCLEKTIVSRLKSIAGLCIGRFWDAQGRWTLSALLPCAHRRETWTLRKIEIFGFVLLIDCVLKIQVIRSFSACQSLGPSD